MRPSIYLSPTPWLAFVVADRSAGLGSTKAAVLALLLASFLAAQGLRNRAHDPIVLLALPLYGALAIASSLTGVNQWDRYDRAISLLVLGAALGVSFRFKPWSLTYARRHCPPSRTASTRFLQENRRLTRWWTFCAVSAGVSMALGASIGGSYGPTLCNWLIPIALSLLATAMPAAVVSELSPNGSLTPSMGGLGRNAQATSRNLRFPDLVVVEQEP